MAGKKNYRECLTTPFETGIRNFTTVAKYYMYYAPEIDSVQSMGHLSTETSQRVFANLLEATSFSGNGIIQKQVRSTSWKKVSLEDEELDFEKSRFLCDQYKEETELHALLRHIRNAFAHGSLYVWRKKKGNYVFLVDHDAKKNRTTAKIMVSLAILEEWKAILENYIAIGE